MKNILFFVATLLIFAASGKTAGQFSSHGNTTSGSISVCGSSASGSITLGPSSGSSSSGGSSGSSSSGYHSSSGGGSGNTYPRNNSGGTYSGSQIQQAAAPPRPIYATFNHIDYYSKAEYDAAVVAYRIEQERIREENEIKRILHDIRDVRPVAYSSTTNYSNPWGEDVRPIAYNSATNYSNPWGGDVRPVACSPITNYSNPWGGDVRPVAYSSTTNYSNPWGGNVRPVAHASNNQQTLKDEIYWTKMYSSINNPRRFATIIGFMNKANGGHLPKPSDENVEGLFAGDNNSVFVISKDGNTISYSDLEGEGKIGFKAEGTLGNFSIDNDGKVSYALLHGIAPKPKVGERAGFSLSVEPHYYVSAGHSKYISINECGGFTVLGTSTEIGLGIPIEAGFNTVGKAGLGVGVSVANVEVNGGTAFCPVINRKEDGSVNASQWGYELSVEGGIMGKVGAVKNKLYFGPIGAGAKIYHPDINAAIKQLPQSVIDKLASDIANEQDNNAIYTHKPLLAPNPFPAHPYDMTIITSATTH